MPPDRAALAAEDYADACRIAFASSEPPRKVSKQLFMLAPKIREVDALLRDYAALAGRVFEVHPEVAFWRLIPVVHLHRRGAACEGGAEDERNPGAPQRFLAHLLPLARPNSPCSPTPGMV